LTRTLLARAYGPPRSICQYTIEKVSTLATQIATEDDSSAKALLFDGWSVMTPIISASSTMVLAI
jgi:hypothetical protein